MKHARTFAVFPHGGNEMSARALLRRECYKRAGGVGAAIYRAAVATNVKVYFRDPLSLWREGRTKTPTAWRVNTCRREPTFSATRHPNWTRARFISISVRENSGLP